MLDQRIEKLHDVRGPMLPVGIERHHVTGILLQCEFYSSLECSALPQINRVRDQGGAGGERNIARAVTRAVIDDNHLIALPQ